jgi:hypothetical protein
MFDPSTLAPLVTMTFVQAWLSTAFKPVSRIADIKMAFESRLILFFYY